VTTSAIRSLSTRSLRIHSSPLALPLLLAQSSLAAFACCTHRSFAFAIAIHRSPLQFSNTRTPDDSGPSIVNAARARLTELEFELRDICVLSVAMKTLNNGCQKAMRAPPRTVRREEGCCVLLLATALTPVPFLAHSSALFASQSHALSL